MIPDRDGRSDGQTVRQTESIIANTALCIARAMLTRCNQLYGFTARRSYLTGPFFRPDRSCFSRPSALSMQGLRLTQISATIPITNPTTSKTPKMPSLLVASDNHTPRNAKSVANINSQKVKIHAALLQSVNPDRVRVIQAKSNIHSSIGAYLLLRPNRL